MKSRPGVRTPGLGAAACSSLCRDSAMASAHFLLFWVPDTDSQRVGVGGDWTQTLLDHLWDCSDPYLFRQTRETSKLHRTPTLPTHTSAPRLSTPTLLPELKCIVTDYKVSRRVREGSWGGLWEGKVDGSSLTGPHSSWSHPCQSSKGLLVWKHHQPAHVSPWLGALRTSHLQARALPGCPAEEDTPDPEQSSRGFRQTPPAIGLSFPICNSRTEPKRALDDQTVSKKCPHPLRGRPPVLAIYAA